MGNNTPILEEEPHIFAAWDRERAMEIYERKKRNKQKIVTILRWLSLIPVALLGSSLVIYILEFTILPQMLLGQASSAPVIAYFVNIMVTYAQMELAHYIAPSHKRAVMLSIFGLTVFLFIVSLFVIGIEAREAETMWSGIGYFFNEAWLEFLRPLTAGYILYQHDYFKKKN